MASKIHFQDLIAKARRQLNQMEKDTAEIQKRLEATTKQVDVEEMVSPLVNHPASPLVEPKLEEVEEVEKKLEEEVVGVEVVEEVKKNEGDKSVTRLYGGVPLLRSTSNHRVIDDQQEDEESNRHFDASSVSLDDHPSGEESLDDVNNQQRPSFAVQLNPIKLEDEEQAFIPPAPQPYLETGSVLPLAKPLDSTGPAPRPERMLGTPQVIPHVVSPDPASHLAEDERPGAAGTPVIETQSSTETKKKKTSFFRKLFSKKKMGSSDSTTS